MKRRNFIFDIFSVGIVSAMSTKLRAVNLNFTPMGRSISTWKTTEANQKAGQMLDKGEHALDAAVAGVAMGLIKEKDNIIVSGLSTTISGLTRDHQIGITTSVAFLYKDLGNSTGATVGVVTDIYVSTIPSFVSAGSSIGIGTEKLKVLKLMILIYLY